jgi:hypothetical protein
MNKQELKILRDAMGILDTIGDKTYDSLLDDGCKPKDASHELFCILQSQLHKGA